MKNPAKLILWIALITVVPTTSAQINDNFGDGNFTVNPPWSGDNTKFTVAANELWLNAPVVTDVPRVHLTKVH